MKDNFTDTELLDFLQEQNDKATYTGKVVFRWSRKGYGWRLHETSRPEAKRDVREAIADAIRKSRRGELAVNNESQKVPRAQIIPTIDLSTLKKYLGKIGRSK
jgi:hypothetical protein